MIGTRRAGMIGGVAAWLGFTLPSAIALVLFGLLARAADVSSAGWVDGLKIAAVAIVAQAVYLMARTLTPDWPRRLLAVLAAIVALAWTTPFAQVAIIAGGALIGRMLLAAAGGGTDRPGAESGVAPRRGVLPDGVRSAPARPATVGGGRRPTGGPVRGLLSERCARLRWRSRRASAAPRDGRRPGLGLQRPVPRRIRSCAGRPRAVVQLRGVSRGCLGPVTERLARSDDRIGRDLPAVVPAGLRRPAVLGSIAWLDRLPARADRDERGCRRDPAGGALHPGLDERDHRRRSTSRSPAWRWRCSSRDAFRRSLSSRSAPSPGSWSPARPPVGR